jgi:mannitol-1-phosphate/altronate dehydrogenase
MQDQNYRRAARTLMLSEQAPTLKVRGLIWNITPGFSSTVTATRR